MQRMFQLARSRWSCSSSDRVNDREDPKPTTFDVYDSTLGKLVRMRVVLYKFITIRDEGGAAWFD